MRRGTIILVWVGLVLIARRAGAELTPEARTLLGNREGRLVVVDEEAGSVAHLLDLATGKLSRLSDEITVAEVKLSPDGKRVLYRQNNDLLIRPVDGGSATRLATGYAPRWWRDSAGEEWVYYSSAFATTYWPDQGFDIKTLRRRLRDSFEEVALAWKTYSGPSADGTHLGTDYITVVIFDENQKANVVNGGQRGCYSSMSPDNRYWLMHHDFDHNRILVHNKKDQLVWFMPMPADVKYVNWATWSSDPELATFAAREQNDSYSLFVFRFSDIDGKTGKVKPGATGPVRLLDGRTGGHSWTTSHLWFASATTLPDAGQPKSQSQGCSLAPRSAAGGDRCGASWFAALLLVVLVQRRIRRRAALHLARGATAATCRRAALHLARVATACVLVLGLALLVGGGCGQESSIATTALAGVVKDKLGVVVSGAQVEVAGKSSYSDAQGKYTLDKLPAGSATVKVTQSWFAPFEETVTLTAVEVNQREIVITEVPLKLEAADESLAASYGKTFDWTKDRLSIVVVTKPTRKDLDNAIYYQA